MEDKFRSLFEAGKCEQLWNCKNPVTVAAICDCGRVFGGCAEHSAYWGGRGWSPIRALKGHLRLHRNIARLKEIWGFP